MIRLTPCCKSRYRDEWRGKDGYFMLLQKCSRCGRELKFVGDLVSYEKHIMGGQDDNKERVQADD